MVTEMNKVVLRILMIVSMAVVFPWGNVCAETLSPVQEIVVDTLDVTMLGNNDGNRILIEKNVDLKGRVCKLSSGKTLVFKGGVIKNGTLKGSMTRIESKGKAFDKVTIKGSWNVPYISTRLFVNLDYINSLRDVFALANPKVKNVIIIEGGHYQVKARKNKDACLTLTDNTELILNGNIQIVPNEFPRYDIIRVKGRNIAIRGKGAIIGDKHTHKGEEGEWGMGVLFHGAINSSIQDVTIKDCWGDCIYVGGKSRDVLIEKCTLDHGRRQGISVTKADSVVIRDCKISNVSGTRPEYAIDLEPNANDTVDNVLIDNVEVVNCEGGILALKGLKSEKTTIGSVVIRNCSLSALSKYPIRLKRSQSALVEKCTINASNERPSIYSSDVNQITIRDNIINIEESIVASVKNKVKGFVGKDIYKPIKVVRTTRKIVKNNKIVEKQ